MKADKQQKAYLKDKIRKSVADAKKQYERDKPIAVSDDDKIAALKKAGFVDSRDDDFRYSARYLNLPQTAQHKKNEAAIKSYNEKLDAILSDAYDNIELGDDADALTFLKQFQLDLKKVK